MRATRRLGEALDHARFVATCGAWKISAEQKESAEKESAESASAERASVQDAPDSRSLKAAHDRSERDEPPSGGSRC